KPTTSSVQADVERAPQKGNCPHHSEGCGCTASRPFGHRADGSAGETTCADRSSDPYGWSSASIGSGTHYPTSRSGCTCPHDVASADDPSGHHRRSRRKTGWCRSDHGAPEGDRPTSSSYRASWDLDPCAIPDGGSQGR
ncbi:MAG: hypothetical protein ACRDBP_00280, partial [Luteolibacter sp.]